MKNTIVSALLLCGVVALLVFHSHFINRKTEEMLFYADRLEQESGIPQKKTALADLDSIWQKSRKSFAVSIPYHKILLIDSHLARIKAFADESGSGEYKAAVYALRDALSALRDDEKLSIHNII